MVRLFSPKETIESCIQPYREALEIEYPISYFFNDNRSYYASTSSDEKVHYISFDPALTFSDIGHKIIPSRFAITGDEDKLVNLITALCNLHLNEKIDGILSPLNVEGNNFAANYFSMLHNLTVSIWCEDLLYKHWPDLFAVRYRLDNEVMRECINGLKRNEVYTEEGYMLLLNAACTRAASKRHNHNLNDEQDAFAFAQYRFPSQMKGMRPLIELWSSLPVISYDARNDVKQYEQSIRELAMRANLKANPRLKRKDGRYQWFLDLRKPN